jgi:hypothetical protein
MLVVLIVVAGKVLGASNDEAASLCAGFYWFSPLQYNQRTLSIKDSFLFLKMLLIGIG